ncbi:helix-turn-helix transcriptional regulator [Pseudomonas nitroreducens]|uniref:Helix-turn-helix transcriptional regulator n=2 Tax=Pseudomonas nitroreducens TaxID=46680 RepID=A0A5R9A6A3_PSENT|nr:helix-turn-helix transcriptional regulator [Pseudomonas nitroreducens]
MADFVSASNAMPTANIYSDPCRVPSLPTGFLPRPRLSKTLLAARCRLRLICAPAGSGKSVLLRECALARPEQTQVLWLDLKGLVLDDVALLRLLAAALELADSDPISVLNCLAQRAGALWIMLDDLPRAADERMDRLLELLLRASAPTVSWWIASRRRPVCKLERLLLDGELLELGAEDLAMTAAELSELLGSLYGEVPVTSVQTLMMQTDGWFAGIRLRLHGRDPGQLPEAMQGNALVRRYLEQEVLAELSGELRDALCKLSCLQDFDDSLCDHVLGAGEGKQLLQQLLDAGVFIETLDADLGLYRVRPAVGSILAAEVAQGLKRALYRHACQWSAGRAQVRQAIDYALLAEQPEIAASLLQHFTRDRLLHGSQMARVLRWRNLLPGELISSTPRLLILNSWALLISGRLDEAEVCAAQLQRFLPQPTAQRQRELLAQCQALSGKLEYHRGKADARHLREALEHLPESAWAQHVIVLTALIEVEIVDGRMETAEQFHRDAIKMARRHGSRMLEAVLLLQQGQLLEMRGELAQALHLTEQLHRELCVEGKGEANPLRGRTRLRLGALLARRGDYAVARGHYEAGLQECLDCEDPAASWGYIGLAELDALHKSLGQAHQRLADAERLLQFRNITEPLYQNLLLLGYARLWIQEGNAGRARTALEEGLRQYSGAECCRPPYGNPELVQHLQVALLHARQAMGEDVSEAFENMLKTALRQERRSLAIELWFGMAEALYAKGQQGGAQRALLDAMALSRQTGMLSAEYHCSLRNPGLIRWGKDSLRPKDQQSAAVLLSPRELSVLKMIALGLSNQDIAEQLFISLHTVKSHAQKINVKLGVARRTQAIVRAKELGLVR